MRRHREVPGEAFSISRRTATVILVLVLGVSAVLVWVLSEPPNQLQTEPDGQSESQPSQKITEQRRPVAVHSNRSPDVLDGFRGDVHPLLRSSTRMDVTANWSTIERSKLALGSAPDVVYSWFTGLRTRLPQQTYTERDFSGFLPTSVGEVGQIWALDEDRVLRFLSQFHPRPSLHLVASGRRAGPDGAFGILRAVSPTYLDIAFRIHAEYYVTPPEVDPRQPIAAWYTPGYFSGNLLVEKRSGRVEYFRLAQANDKDLNVFLTVNPSALGVSVLGHDIIRVDRMELSGGDARIADRIAWTKALTSAEAGGQLAKVFYKYNEIDWQPFDQVAARAKSLNRPIFAIASWGSTEDQSC